MCLDATVRNLVASAVRDIIGKRIAVAPSSQEVALEAVFGRDGGVFAPLWTHACNATQQLEKCIGSYLMWCEERRELGVLLPRVKNTERTIIAPRARTMLERTLEDAIHG